MCTSFSIFSKKIKLRIIYTSKLFIVIMQLLLLFTNQSSEEDNMLMVCDIESLVRDLINLISNHNENEGSLSNQLESYTCSNYLSLPEAFVIDTQVEYDDGVFYDYPSQPNEIEAIESTSNHEGLEMVEEYLPEEIEEPQDELADVDLETGEYEDYSTRIKRSINLGVPTNEIFETEIAMLVPDAFHQYAILGGEAKFNCFGDESAYMSYYEDGLISHMEWTYLNKASITSAVIIIDRTKGSLFIPSVQLRDSEIYECHVELSDTSLDKPVFQTFTHQLSVVTEKTYSLITNAKYTVFHCNEHEMNAIKIHIPKWIIKYICPVCEIYGESIKCVEEQETESIYQVHFTISTLGLEFEMEHEKTLECDITCLEIIQAVILENIRNSMDKFLMIPIEVIGSTSNHKNVHIPIPPNDVRLAIGCLGGFELYHKLCFPCNPGSFSETGETYCTLCPVATYQLYPGATACIPCHDGETTSSEGSKTIEDCEVLVVGTNRKYLIWILIGIVCPILSIMIILLLIFCCCPKTRIGICVTKFCCCCCMKSTPQDYNYKPIDEEGVLSTTKEDKYDKKVEIKKQLKTLRKTSESKSGRPSPAVLTQYSNKDKGKLKNIQISRSSLKLQKGLQETDSSQAFSGEENVTEDENQDQHGQLVGEETCKGCDAHMPHKCIKPSPFRALLKHTNFRPGQQKTGRNNNNFTPPIPPKMPDVPLYL